MSDSNVGFWARGAVIIPVYPKSVQCSGDLSHQSWKTMSSQASVCGHCHAATG